MSSPFHKDISDAAENTDRELWREVAGDAYAPSIHVTVHGGIGIDVGGVVYVMPLRQWHKLATNFADPASLNPLKKSTETTS